MKPYIYFEGKNFPKMTFSQFYTGTGTTNKLDISIIRSYHIKYANALLLHGEQCYYCGFSDSYNVMQITYFEYVAKHVDVFAPITTSENVVIRNLIKEIYFALLKRLRICVW